jgi:hypothetical protein
MGTPQPKKNADKKRDGKKWKNSRPAPIGQAPLLNLPDDATAAGTNTEAA